MKRWLDHKEQHPWILWCVSPAMSDMRKEDWYSTSNSTNAAESAHAKSKRLGVHLSLLAAISKGRKIDSEFLTMQRGRITFGISSRYGNMGFIARKKKNIRRQQNKMKKAAQTSRRIRLLEDNEEELEEVDENCDDDDVEAGNHI